MRRTGWRALGPPQTRSSGITAPTKYMGKTSSTKAHIQEGAADHQVTRRPVLRAWFTMSRAVTALTNDATSACARANEGNAVS